MDAAVDAWRIKILSRKNKNDVPSCTTCRYVKSKTCGSDKRNLKCKKPPPTPDPSLASLKKSLSKNCCACCCILLEFFKEAYKTVQGDPNSRVCDVLCEISDLLLALANDCVLLLRQICRCFLESLH
ncbi:unnamed protein product [Euphydryas editha]|uniref:Uncharacterized protein n=1 Tax=Euphydryas editha TaxID=104508 RepID=A0AAU9UV54_EUPED|nr:unnamed protein product [Euphydryas editha]